MSARTKARKRALDVLFESDLRGLPLDGTLAARVSSPDRPFPAYAVELVEGVVAHRAAIDRALADYSVGWTLDRMPVVDRNILRIGAYEILYRDDVPDEVVLSEAAAIARELSTEESPGFVNGLLAQLVRVKPQLRAAAPDSARPAAEA